MFQFKAEPCPVSEPHSWDDCPYAHKGERKARRNPKLYNYEARACQPMRSKGFCPLGDSCPLSHNVYECGLHPTRYRTQMCILGKQCSRAVCFFAHAPDELRSPTVTEKAAGAKRSDNMSPTDRSPSPVGFPSPRSSETQASPVAVSMAQMAPAQQAAAKQDVSYGGQASIEQLVKALLSNLYTSQAQQASSPPAQMQHSAMQPVVYNPSVSAPMWANGTQLMPGDLDSLSSQLASLDLITGGGWGFAGSPPSSASSNQGPMAFLSAGQLAGGRLDQVTCSAQSQPAYSNIPAFCTAVRGPASVLQNTLL